MEGPPDTLASHPCSRGLLTGPCSEKMASRSKAERQELALVFTYRLFGS